MLWIGYKAELGWTNFLNVETQGPLLQKYLPGFTLGRAGRYDTYHQPFNESPMAQATEYLLAQKSRAFPQYIKGRRKVLNTLPHL